jgi:hypothetical protein
MTGGRRSIVAGTVAVLAATALSLWTLTSPTQAGFTAAMQNSASSLGAGTLAFDHAYAGRSCTPASLNSQPIPCIGSLYPASSTGSTTSTITQTGTIAATGQEARIASCGAVSFADSTSAGDHLVARGNVGFGYPGPFPGSAAAHFDGATALGSGIKSIGTGSLFGNSFSQGIWFKTDTAGYADGGALMGIGSSPTDATGTNYDHVIWMDAAGRLGFGIQGTVLNITDKSSVRYNDGNWHFAVLNIAVTGILVYITSGTLYVDGVSVAGSTWTTALTGYTGYWHIGWNQLGSRWDSVNPYFQGSLANAFTVNDTLTSGQRDALYGAGNQATWQSRLASYGANRSWTLGDTGTTTILANTNLPSIGTASPCSYVDISWGFSNPTSCVVAPASATAACTLTTTKLSTAADGVWRPIAPASLGGTQDSLITLSKDSTYAAKASYLAGIVIYAPISLRMYVGSSFATSRWNCVFTWADVASPTTATSSFLL